MKKLVLIPQERYEQLVTRESAKEEHSEPVEPVITKPTEESPPKPDGQGSGKAINKEEEEEEGEKTEVLGKVPPPPGEPVLTRQIGGGQKKKKKKKVKSKNKSEFWRVKWTSY